MSALDGMRVLELSGGVAVRYCARLLARLGADVVVTHPPDDDTGLGYGGEAGRAFGRWLDEGKQRASSAVGGFDLVLADRATPVPEAVARLAPTLVTIGWFARGGPYDGRPATDETVLAAAGLAYPFGERDGPPTLAQGHVPQLLAGANACGVALAALVAPSERRPRHVDVDVFESTMCLAETGAVAALADPRAVSTRFGVNRFSPTYPASSYATSDGWVGVTCLTPSQWSAMCDAVARPELAADEAYLTAFRRLSRADEVDAALAPALAERTTAEWVAEGDRRRIPITPMPTPAELPHHEHWRRRGSFAAIAGTATLAPTLPFVTTFSGEPVPPTRGDRPGGGPLAGVRVVDFTMGWAGPFVTRTLGDLGADVVKVESLTHPDWWRGWEARVEQDPPSTELQPHFNAMNRNKRGVAVDLTTTEGAATARALIATADVVIDNFAAGVIGRLGFGHAEQQRLRPGVVSVSMPAFGSAGPLSGLRAYGSTVEQASGLPFVNGQADWPPAIQHVAFGDPIAGVYGVVAVLSALLGARRLGGASVELAQVPCLFELGADAVIAAEVDGAVPRTGNRRARLDLCAVVPVAGDRAWIAVALDGGLTAAKASLVEATGADPDSDPEASLTAWAAGKTAEDAVERLHGAGVAASSVVPAHRLGHDPHLVATGFWHELDRVHVGRHSLGGPAFRLDGHRPTARRPAPALGEHTDEVLGDLPPAPGPVGS